MKVSLLTLFSIHASVSLIGLWDKFCVFCQSVDVPVWLAIIFLTLTLLLMVWFHYLKKLEHDRYREMHLKCSNKNIYEQPCSSRADDVHIYPDIDSGQPEEPFKTRPPLLGTLPPPSGKQGTKPQI